jgi:hypothetical protein
MTRFSRLLLNFYIVDENDVFMFDVFVAVDDEELSTQLEGLGVGEHAFSQMQGDLDQQRLLGDLPTYNSEYTSETMMKEVQNKLRYKIATKKKQHEFYTICYKQFDSN